MRYRAVASDALTSADLDALPYGRIGDAVGLVPYILGGGDGTPFVSDRGLGGGAAIVVDDGASVPNLAPLATGFADFPDRYARRVDISRADRAFLYGGSGGAGRIALDELGNASTADLDAGAARDVVIASMIGSFHVGSGVSSDDGTIARRADVDLTRAFAGGELRIGATAASQGFDTRSATRRVDDVRLAYVTASRRFSTSADASESTVDFAIDSGGAVAYHTRYFDTDFRIEHAGPVSLAAGLRTSIRSLTYAPPDVRFGRNGRTDDETAYVEARTTIGALATHVALGGDRIGVADFAKNRTHATVEMTLSPEFDARVELGGGAFARIGYAQSARLPTLARTVGGVATNYAYAGSLERAALLDSALGFDSGNRVRGELVAYRERTHGADSRELVGLGLSFAWEVAPRLSLRAWTLHAAPQISGAYAPGFDATTRGVAWVSYDSGSVRIDAIAHRDVVATGGAITGIDGDLNVRVASGVTFDIGTFRRAGTQRYALGVRVR